MVPASDPHHYAVGVKELLASHQNRSTIALMLRARKGRLAVCRFPFGRPDGRRISLTNKDSVSLGLVCGLGDIAHAKKVCRKCWKILNNTPPFARY